MGYALRMDAAGEVFTALGPSGSGKSTLRRRVGMVFQAAALFGGAVLDNVLYRPRLRARAGALLLAVVAIGGSTLVTLGLMLAPASSPAARDVIPIAGMIVGNSMNVASVTAVRLVQDAGDRRAQIEAVLALGASPRQCTADIIRRSVRLAMVPVIDSTKTMGIVFLPGAMTGMILAGADPLQAVRLQVVVVFMLLAAVSLTATIVSLLSPGRLFTPQQQLRRLGG